MGFTNHLHPTSFSTKTVNKFQEENTLMKPIYAEKPSIEWKKGDGYYSSTNDRFSIIKETGRLHNGDWQLRDNFAKEEFYGYSLKHAKQIAENVLLRNPDGHPPEKSGYKVSEELWHMEKENRENNKC